MLEFLTANLGTIVVGVIVLAVIAAIVRKLVLDKKSGKCCGCDGGCSADACDSAAGCGASHNRAAS